MAWDHININIGTYVYVYITYSLIPKSRSQGSIKSINSLVQAGPGAQWINEGEQ